MSDVPLGVALLVCAAVGVIAYWRGRHDGRDAESFRWRSRAIAESMPPMSYVSVDDGDECFLVFTMAAFFRQYHNPLVRYRRKRNQPELSAAERMYG